MDAVLQNDLVLEIILKFAISGERKKICKKDLCSVRLVQKLWLKTVSTLIQKIEYQAPYNLELDENNSLNNSINVQANGKLLDQFTSTFTSNHHLQISVLPGNVSLAVEFFQLENYDNLLKYFRQCGQHVATLGIDFPLDGGSMPLSFPQFTLPNLISINFKFTDTNCKNDQQDDEKNEVFGNNRNGLAFLQLLLNASSKLKYFQLMYSAEKYIPAHFQYIQLPGTVTEVVFDKEFTTKLEEFMLRQNLPKLQRLHLKQNVSAPENTAIFKVFERFQKTLKSVTIYGTNIHFPKMDSLEELRFPYFAIRKGDPSLSFLHTFLPKLKKVDIGGQVQTWSNKFGVLTTVKILDVSLLFGNEAKYLNCQVMERLHKAFPNLERLSVGVHLNKMTSLKYVVGRMSELKELNVFFLGEVDDSATNKIENVLLGLPNKTMRASLLNLSELESLSFYSENALEDGESSLLTNSIFTLGLQQMANLRNLHLFGRFKPTSEMEEMWRDQNKCIKYREGGIFV